MAHKKGSFFTEMLKENTRGLCQACSKLGTRLGITREVTGCLYSTATWRVQAWNLPASHPSELSMLFHNNVHYPYHRSEDGGAQIRMVFTLLVS